MASSDAFAANGLTGATLPSRYAGATASGPPLFGSFAVGDFVVDRSGQTFICTAAGQPGTWTGAGLAAANTWTGVNTFSQSVTVPEGANAYMGTVAVNGSTAVTVTTTAVAATSRIFLTTQVPAGTPGAPFVASTSVATNFTLKSSGASDTSTVAWLIINHT